LLNFIRNNYPLLRAADITDASVFFMKIWSLLF